MTTRRKGVYSHLELLDARDWGLIVYDEVHLLPAPIFRMTADLQARRRLGLTATLVREDGREGDVFSLIGPKRYDAPWKDIEAQGWIAPADCVEVRVTLPSAERMAYADRRARGALPARVVHPPQDRRRRRPGRAAPRPADAGDRAVPRPARRARRRPRRAGDQGRDPGQGAAAALRGVPLRRGRAAGRLARSRTSRSTCRPPRWRSRSPARSARARRRPSASAGCCGPKSEGKTAHFYTIVSPRHRRRRVRPEPAAVPGRAGLRLPDPRRRRLSRATAMRRPGRRRRLRAGRAPIADRAGGARRDRGDPPARDRPRHLGGQGVARAVGTTSGADRRRARSTSPAGRRASRRREPQRTGGRFSVECRRVGQVYTWVDIADPDTGLDPEAVGELLAGCTPYAISRTMPSTSGSRRRSAIASGGRAQGLPGRRGAVRRPTGRGTPLPDRGRVDPHPDATASRSATSTSGRTTCAAPPTAACASSTSTTAGRPTRPASWRWCCSSSGSGDAVRELRLYDAYVAAGGPGRVTSPRGPRAHRRPAPPHRPPPPDDVARRARDAEARARSLAGVEEFLGYAAAARRRRPDRRHARIGQRLGASGEHGVQVGVHLVDLHGERGVVRVAAHRFERHEHTGL